MERRLPLVHNDCRMGSFMITISLCMIVKNEERHLKRCLDSLDGLMDELIIVDTGSEDRTKEIARQYTEQVYDFAWTGDFAMARNFAFSKARMEYIYTADADEVLEKKSREQFRLLKESLLPEIEIVQMYYANQLSFGTIYNYDRELRPKLFRRQREFVWEGAVHEQVRLTPVVYDSEIEILHMPESCHKDRDLAAFAGLAARGVQLDRRLHGIYARELFVSGEPEDFAGARSFFQNSCREELRSEEEIKEAACVAARAARLAGDTADFFKYTSKVLACGGCAEICCELGAYYLEKKDIAEAVLWYYNGAYETESILNLRCSGDIALRGLSEAYHAFGEEELAQRYREMADAWKAEENGSEI